MNGTFGEPQSEKIGVKSVYRKSLKRQGVAWKHLIKKLVNLTNYRDNNRYRLDL
jgi:hypothetical protein